METDRRQPSLKLAAFHLGHICLEQIERALHKSHTDMVNLFAAPSQQYGSDSESVSFTLGCNWQEAGQGYHLSCH